MSSQRNPNMNNSSSTSSSSSSSSSSTSSASSSCTPQQQQQPHTQPRGFHTQFPLLIDPVPVSRIEYRTPDGTYNLRPIIFRFFQYY